MPHETETDDATREAATARVVQRLFTNPGDRNVFRVVSDEFGVGERLLRGWVEAATPAGDARSRRAPRPRFSPVVRTRVEPAVASEGAAEPAPEPAPASTPEPAPTPEPEHTAAALDDRRASLESEIARLRQGNESLKAAMRALLSE
ncbi:hypothetical protein [Frondihabitans cladoniiphilus]|uniref:Transposase n=1 Tax=Frondihabitans cladoniiphilus TaxID=715785 RepID=A0ABP8VH16_9MICO